MNEKEKQLARTLEQFIDGLGLKHFKGKELTWYWDRTRNGIKNTVPPSSLWPNIVPTLRALDEIRKRAGVQIMISSSYRSPSYNRAIAGAGRSYHMEFKAIDFYSSHMSATQLWAIARRVRQDGIFKGGIGKYPGFVHIDCRGTIADW